MADAGMLRPQSFFPNRERALEEWFRFSVPSLRTVEGRQVIQTESGLRMLWSERLLPNTDSALILRFGIRIVPLRTIDLRQIVQAGSLPLWEF